MNKILLLGSQHGNELLGDVLYDYVLKTQPSIAKHITFMRGNLKAYRQKKRLIESDLNRSYTGGKSTYEERRASRILHYIKKSDFDLVLDLHTTTCNQLPCIIVESITDENLRYLRATSIDKIVKMSSSAASTSLIGVYPKTVSIEVYDGGLTTLLMSQLASDIKRYLIDSTHSKTKTIYEIDGVLRKGELSDKEIAGLKNFEYSHLGFYPILVGEKSYQADTDYLGFKAHKISDNKV